jgi:hypothetical protein
LWHVWGRGEAYTGFWWGKLRERELGRLRHRWADNIKMDLKELGCGGMDWINLAHDRGTCECGNETSGAIKCGKFRDYLRTG